MKKAIIFIILVALVLGFTFHQPSKDFLEDPINDGKVYCKPEQRSADFCIEVYQPVCGAKDNGIRCITEPCDTFEFKTYSNSCFACLDSDVIYYEEGECL